MAHGTAAVSVTFACEVNGNWLAMAVFGATITVACEAAATASSRPAHKNTTVLIS